MRIANRKTPRTSSAMRRPLMCTHVTLSATASAVRQTPRVMKNAMAPRRRVRFMLAQEYTGTAARLRCARVRPPKEGGLVVRELGLCARGTRVLRVKFRSLHLLGETELLH